MQRASCLILFEVSAALEDRVLLPLLQLLRDEQLPKYVARTEAVTSHLRASRWLYISKISTLRWQTDWRCRLLGILGCCIWMSARVQVCCSNQNDLLGISAGFPNAALTSGTWNSPGSAG